MLTEEQKKLVEKNHNLIYFCVRKWGLQIDEYYDICAIALCEAASKYNHSNGAKFSTYASVAIQNALKVYHRHNNAKKRIPSASIISFESPITEEGLVIGDTITDGLDLFDKINWLDYSILTEQELSILNLAYIGFNQSEIGKELELTQSLISRKLKKIERKLLNEE